MELGKSSDFDLFKGVKIEFEFETKKAIYKQLLKHDAAHARANS
jgi:hypothetical protein